jgi:zinc D-Ala-D-Ala dipeptidase
MAGRFVVFAAAMMLAVIAVAQPSATGVSDSRQMVVVVTKNWDDFHGTAQRYERSEIGSKWRVIGQAFPVVVGKSGLAWGRGLQPDITDETDVPVKREGDKRAPAGIFPLTSSFGYSKENLSGARMPYLFLSNTVECVDDPHSSRYNQLVDTKEIKKDWNSSEQMRSEDDYYRWGIFVGYNTNPAQSGAGSCIFLHIWGGRDEGTVGCTAMALENIQVLLRWLDPRKHPVLVQLPEAEYMRRQVLWSLPPQP